MHPASRRANPAPTGRADCHWNDGRRLGCKPDTMDISASNRSRCNYLIYVCTVHFTKHILSAQHHPPGCFLIRSYPRWQTRQRFKRRRAPAGRPVGLDSRVLPPPCPWTMTHGCSRPHRAVGVLERSVASLVHGRRCVPPVRHERAVHNLNGNLHISFPLGPVGASFYSLYYSIGHLEPLASLASPAPSTRGALGRLLGRVSH